MLYRIILSYLMREKSAAIGSDDEVWQSKAQEKLGPKHNKWKELRKRMSEQRRKFKEEHGRDTPLDDDLVERVNGLSPQLKKLLNEKLERPEFPYTPERGSIYLYRVLGGKYICGDCANNYLDGVHDHKPVMVEWYNGKNKGNVDCSVCGENLTDEPNEWWQDRHVHKCCECGNDTNDEDGERVHRTPNQLGYACNPCCKASYEGYDCECSSCSSEREEGDKHGQLVEEIEEIRDRIERYLDIITRLSRSKDHLVPKVKSIKFSLSQMERALKTAGDTPLQKIRLYLNDFISLERKILDLVESER